MNVLGKPIKQQAIDQLAHFVIGYLATAALTLIVSPVVAIIVVMMFVLAREVYQHGGFKFGLGSITDQMVFLIGALVTLIKF